MPTARFFVSIFALGVTALLWLAANPQASAHQNAPPARAPDQSTILPLDGAEDFPELLCLLPWRKRKRRRPGRASLKDQSSAADYSCATKSRYVSHARVRSIIAGDENHAAHGSREMPVCGPVFHQIENDQDLGYVRLQNVTEYLISIQQK